jgi:dolichol-phosphate mannosyltransferase
MNLHSSPSSVRSELSSVQPRAIELTVVVPTFNEAENVPLLIARLDEALAGVEWEVVFVDDDSPDGTSQVVRDIAARDRRVRIIQRIGRRGLSTACVEGVLSSAAPYFAVMDGDLQHDDSVLGTMFDKLRRDRLDVVVGSRYKEGSRTGGLNPWRKSVSRWGGRVARLVLRGDLTDPMSGYFVMSRKAFDSSVHALSQQGFKILLDLFASSPRPLQFAEVPCEFHARQHGASKLDTMAAWEFGVLILDKLVGRVLPVRFVIFAVVGATGIAVHLLALWGLLARGADFTTAQTAAVVTAMTWNFFLNNTITYRDRRLRGAGLIRGLAAFYAIGAIGALANVGVASMLFQERHIWWLAALAGALMGLAWNFTLSSLFTWGNRSTRP